MDAANIPALRDTLITALQQYQTGPRTIIVQLCLALIGLALQYPAWQNPVQQIVETFGKNPTTVPVLLQFLTLLPEELSSATRYPLTVRITTHFALFYSSTIQGRRSCYEIIFSAYGQLSANRRTSCDVPSGSRRVIIHGSDLHYRSRSIQA